MHAPVERVCMGGESGLALVAFIPWGGSLEREGVKWLWQLSPVRVALRIRMKRGK